MLRVLIVEDSEDDAMLLVHRLRHGGYEMMFERVDTAEAMNAALADKAWDIVISDYVMPHFSGLEALRLLRQSGLDLPFIIVSGKIGEDTAVEAMKAGAHDYIIKGNLTRLIPAIERELREASVRKERREAQEALLASAKQWQTTFDAISEAICLLDKEYRILRCNTAMAALIGKPVSRIIGSRCYELMHGASLPIKECPLTRMWKTQRREILMLPLKEKWFNVTVDPLLDDTGNITGTVHIMADVTERKKAEEILEEKLKLLEEKGISRYDSFVKTKNSYILKEKRYDKSIAIFSSMTRCGLSGLCMTVVHPDMLNEIYDLKECKGQFVWLSTAGGEENIINPSNLTAMHEETNKFIKNNKKSIILLLGLENIITLNGFERSLNFVNSIIDLIIINNSRLIITVNPEAMVPREISLIEKSLIEIRDDDLIRLGLK